MRRGSVFITLALLMFASSTQPLNAAIKAGDKCIKIGSEKSVKNSVLVCKKVKGKLVWTAKPKESTEALTLQVWRKTGGPIVQESGLSDQLYSPEKTVKVGNTYRSYFVSKAEGFLVFNESADGFTYTKQVKTNLRRSKDLGTDTTLMDHPVVMQLKSGKFLMVYDICTGNCDVPPSLPRRLVVRTSADGITWGDGKMIPGPSKSGLNPEGKIFDSVPSLVELPSGEIRVYYVQGGAAIGSAITKDGGASWTVEDGFRIGTPYGNTPLKEAFIDPVAIRDSSGIIYLYFGYVTDWNCMESGGTPNGCVPIRMAQSSDGLNFKLIPGNVITPESGATQFGDPDIFIGPDGKWLMLYADVSNNNKQFKASLRLAVRDK